MQPIWQGCRLSDPDCALLEPSCSVHSSLKKPAKPIRLTSLAAYQTTNELASTIRPKFRPATTNHVPHPRSIPTQSPHPSFIPRAIWNTIAVCWNNHRPLALAAARTAAARPRPPTPIGIACIAASQIRQGTHQSICKGGAGGQMCGLPLSLPCRTARSPVPALCNAPSRSAVSAGIDSVMYNLAQDCAHCTVSAGMLVDAWCAQYTAAQLGAQVLSLHQPVELRCCSQTLRCGLHGYYLILQSVVIAIAATHLALELGVDALEHRRVFEHVGHDKEPDAAAGTGYTTRMTGVAP